MPSGQTGPQPMTMPFGGGFNSPFGGFGGMPMFGPAQQFQQPIQSQIPMGTDPAGGPNAAAPQKNYGPIGGMVNTAQQQVQQPAPTSQMNSLMTNFPGGYQPPTQQPPIDRVMPSMGGVAPGMGRGKGRTGPGTSGGFSGGCGVTPRGTM